MSKEQIYSQNKFSYFFNKIKEKITDNVPPYVFLTKFSRKIVFQIFLNFRRWQNSKLWSTPIKMKHFQNPEKIMKI
jgi:hypothetical protein